MRFAAVVAALLMLSMPLAMGESLETPGLEGVGGTVWLTWGVAGIQLTDGTAVGVRYWQNATAGGEPFFVYATLCFKLDSGAGHCDRTPLHA